MASQQPNSNPSQKPAENKAQQGGKDQKSNPKKSSRFEKIRKNKGLFSVLFLIVVIVIAAIGVGIYALLNQPNDSANVNENEQVAQDNTDVALGEEGEIPVSEDGNEGEDNSDITDAEGDTNIDTNTETNNTNGSVDGNGASTTAGNALATGHSQAGLSKSQANSRNILATGVWQATDYTNGDIVDSPYTIQLGDTLWEIAEGYYGDGFKWSQIKDANPSSVTTLPDGSWALILPEAVLTLP